MKLRDLLKVTLLVTDEAVTPNLVLNLTPNVAIAHY